MKTAIFIACATLMSTVASRAEDSTVRNVSREVVAGKTVVVGSHVSWNGNCQGLAGWFVDIVKAPKLGTICVRGAAVAPEAAYSVVREDARHCIGKPMSGFEIVYTAGAGAGGVDQVSYVYGIRRPQLTVEAKIEVRSVASANLDRAEEAAREQLPAQMPECPALGY